MASAQPCRRLHDARRGALARDGRRRGATARSGAHWLGDGQTFLELRSATISGWDAFIAAVTESTIAPPQGGPAAHPAFGPLNAREFVAFTVYHARDHARQLRDVRGLAPGQNPGDSSGDLGRRRQTAH